MPRPKEFDYDDKLTIARDLFWKKGYNATTLNDLVDSMKINRSSLYLTYGNKHDLFVKSLMQYIQMKDEQYSAAANKSEKPLEAIASIIRTVSEYAWQESNCLSTNSIYELALSDKKVSKLLQDQSLKAVELFEKLLKRAQEEGTFNKDKDPRAHAHFLVSGLASIYYNQILYTDIKLTRQTAEILIQSIMN